MDLESVFDTAVSGDRQGKGASVWQAEVALRLSKPRTGGVECGGEREPRSHVQFCRFPAQSVRYSDGAAGTNGARGTALPGRALL